MLLFGTKSIENNAGGNVGNDLRMEISSSHVLTEIDRLYITFLTFQTRSEMQFIAQPYVPLLGDLISGAFGGIV